MKKINDPIVYPELNYKLLKKIRKIVIKILENSFNLITSGWITYHIGSSTN